jgi:Tol biopolymer transport system component
MGEVYRARDTRLGRLVAIKLIKGDLAGDPKRRARFEREARVISSLTHPNICQLYDVGTHEGTSYLVMEHIEGETLASKLLAGTIPFRQALSVGAEIASALDAAHRQHVIHRDVKPSNIMCSRSGAKLLDFGIARDAPHRETDRGTLTDEGSAPGTMAYMAPEALSGLPADARTDIWALGIVLYEMVTGEQPFRGETRAELLSKILTADPDWEAIEHPQLRQLIATCLAKDPDQRWQSAQDISQQLRWLGGTTTPARSLVPRRRMTLLLAGALALAAVVALGTWRRERTETTAPSLSIAIPSGADFGVSANTLAISPDGRFVAFIVRRMKGNELYVRKLDGFALTLLHRTDEWLLADPAFSHDGQWIAFAQGTQILKVRTTGGGPTLRVADNRSSPRGISWGPDGSIYFATFSGGLFRALPDGSPPRQITIPDESAGENNHRYPHALGDGRHVLFTVRTGRITSFDEARIALLDLRTGRWKVVLDGGATPQYLHTGHMVFVQQRRLMAVPLDLERGMVRGQPVAMAGDVVADPSTGAAHYAVAASAGTLIYLSGGPVDRRSHFRMVSRSGDVTATLLCAEPVDTWRVSPDSTLIATQIAGANDDISVWDVARNTVTRVTFLPGDEFVPSWSADGKSIFFSTYTGLFNQPINQSAEPRQVFGGEAVSFSSAWPDGQRVAVSTSAGDPQATDILIVDVAGNSRPRAFAATGFNEYAPEVSPDGRWVAFISDESGNRDEAFLRPASGAGRVQISSGGAAQLRWSGDGKEIFYRRLDEFYSVSVGEGMPPSVGPPHLLFRYPRIRYWDVFRNGFLLQDAPQTPFLTAGINVVPGWADRVGEGMR